MKVNIKLITLFSVFLLISCSDNRKSTLLAEFKNANTLYINGETDKALEILERIEKENPDFYPALYLSGKLYLHNNSPDRAEEKWRKIINKHPYHIQSGKQLLRLYTEMEKYSEAEELFVNLSQYSSDDPELLILAGNLLKKEEKYLEAIEYYSKAFLFEEKIIYAHLDIAEIYGRYGITDKSESHLEKAASIGGKEHALYEPVMSVLEKKK